MTNSVLLLKERIHNSQHRVMHNDGSSEVEISIFRVSTTPITSDWPEMLDFMTALTRSSELPLNRSPLHRVPLGVQSDRTEEY
jgi:hypothetical protein